MVADVPPERRLHDGVDVAGVQSIARRLCAIDLDVEIGLSEHAESAEIGDALTLAISLHDLIGDLLQLGQVAAR